ncbi:MAG TPA: rRNA maturation RNase YbeY [Rhizomicrobium sp.]|nr:rRNA maturation RNase YbeY [Rhizomicrobium sp.]
MSVTLMIEDPKWRTKRGLGARLKRAAQLAQARGGNARGGLTILLSSDARLKALNTTFRGKDKATNVLSFPARRGDYLGDVAIAYGVTTKEARAAKKSFADHATHLAIHGVLHLLGYDHETARAARVMEPLETAILDELGIADPYASKAA